MSTKHELPELPRRCDDLEMITPALREAYESAPDGGFKLTAQASRLQDEFEATCAAIEAERDGRLAEIEAQHKRQDRQMIQLEIARAVREAGVPSELASAVEALLIAREPFAVKYENGEAKVGVDGPNGIASVDFVVQTFIASDAGRAYRPVARKGTAPGPLTVALHNLRNRLH